jgi:hypothetical protein
MNQFLKVLKTKKSIFLILCLVLYNSIFNTYTGKKIIHHFFPKFSTGSIQFELEKFSLLHGFVFHKIELKSGDDFNKEIFFKAERLSISYSIPSLFIGKISLNDVSLTEPFINLFQKNGKWNYETIFISSKKEEEPKKESEPLNEIYTFFPIYLDVNFFVDKLNFKFESEKGPNYKKFFLNDFSVFLYLKTYRKNRYPMNLEILNALQNFEFKLNPKNKISIDSADNLAKLNTELRLFLEIYLNREKYPVFNSRMDFGSESIPIRLKKGNIQPFNLELGYDLKYSPLEDYLDLKDFHFHFSKNKFIQAKGFIKKLLENDPEVDFEITDSFINLDYIERITDTVPIIPPMNMSGFLELKPIKAKGSFSNLEILANVLAKKIEIDVAGKHHSIPIFNLDTFTSLNLLSKNEPTETNPIPILKFTELKNLELIYNGISLNGKGIIDPDKNINLKLKLQNLVLDKFSKEVQGNAKLDIIALGNQLSNFNLDINAYINQFRYKLGRAISGFNFIGFNFRTNIDLKKNLSLEEIKTKKVNLYLENENKSRAVDLQTDLDLINKDSFKLIVKNLNLNAIMTNLIPTLPISFRKTISNLRAGLGDDLSLQGELELHSKKREKEIQVNLKAKLPALEMNDLSLDLLIKLFADEEETIQIDKLNLFAYDKKLKTSLKGYLNKPKKPNLPFGEYTANLDGNMSIESEQKRKILRGIDFIGDIDINFKVEDRFIKGMILSKDSSIFYKVPNCKEESCNEYEVNHIQLKIPFLHDLLDKTTEELISGNKKNYIKTYGQKEEPNIIIKEIRGTHPRFPDKKMDLVKYTNGESGLSGRIDYIENYLTLENLKIHTLNGVISGKNILFNIGNSNPEEMEYEGVIQVRDIDLRELLTEEARKKISDGKLKIDLNFSGRNLLEPLSNSRIFFSTYYLGDDFGKSAIRMINQDNIITDTVTRLYKVDRIEIELNKGLIYAVIKFKKQLVGLLSLDNDQISQERIPLANFMQSARKEIDSYNNIK